LASLLFVALCPILLLALAQAGTPNLDPKAVERGKYLSKIAGCNDCHTSGYLLNSGSIPQNQWLLGDQFGWRGPWGTTYASNLRIFMSGITEDAWVQVARSLKSRPPMPWFTLNEMEETDLRAIYQFVRSLGPMGEPAPSFVPPDQEPNHPYALFPSPASSGREIKELVLQMYKEFDAGKLAAFEPSISPGFAAHVMGNQSMDWDGFVEFGSQFRTAFPDGHHVFDYVVEQGEYVVTVGSYRGTHEGELMGIVPTHRQISLAVMHFDRVEGGKIVEHRGIGNALDLMSQLGVSFGD
jgi:predicted ester cyclase/mono/diheme cytochrome c family protein